MEDIRNEVQKRFIAALSEQTNWGKNQVEVLYTQIERDVYLHFLSKVMDRRN